VKKIRVTQILNKEESLMSKKILILLSPLLLIDCGGYFTQSDRQSSPPGESSKSGAIANFAAINADILQPKCLRCHGSQSASGGVDLSSYAAIVSQPGLVVAGSASTSLLYTEVEGGSMPVGGPPLSARELDEVQQWIDAGAGP
jgi:uncharacterized membrane protein